MLEKEIDNNRLELIDSGDPIGMNEEATAVRKRKDASINVAMDWLKLIRQKLFIRQVTQGLLWLLQYLG